LSQVGAAMRGALVALDGWLQAVRLEQFSAAYITTI
jgi:hypothetical protein